MLRAQDLPVASYRVTASLDGFSNVTRNKVTVAPSTVTRLDFTMRLASICECVQVKLSLADHLANADAVLHVRIADDEPDGSDDRGSYPHRATVISAVKTPGTQTLARVVVWQEYLPLFDVGQEMIAFLKSAGPDAFNFTYDQSGFATSGNSVSGDGAARPERTHHAGTAGSLALCRNDSRRISQGTARRSATKAVKRQTYFSHVADQSPNRGPSRRRLLRMMDIPCLYSGAGHRHKLAYARCHAGRAPLGDRRPSATTAVFWRPRSRAGAAARSASRRRLP